MNIPTKIRKEADKFYEAYDNQDYVISVASGKYIPKKGDVFNIRHYHHIDRNRSNNEIWNLAPLSYEEHILKEHTKCDKNQRLSIYENMCNLFPSHEDHYRKYLLGDDDE
ncbi:hypothetical protein [uncultured Thomasclavelia sp.]|uniref:hypothetical protein n=1 Tax=uncultured Thomasclavelia sp. TaxID=3025759 RepID=UPI002596E312|nr:hypothetical protein [uncultured Thomasclavelia sp.]